MAMHTTTPWHRESYEKFMRERLSDLLSARLPMAGFQVEETGSYACTVRVALACGGVEIEVVYEGIPWPDENGIFEFGGERFVVPPVASDHDLEKAEVRCVGDLVYEAIEQQLGAAPADLNWDESLARNWLALDARVVSALRAHASKLDPTNLLARLTHLRRIIVSGENTAVHPSHRGRVCLLETPEGPNIGRILTVAAGAAIRGGRLVVVEEGPAAALGLSASMIPFLEHSDPTRLLMGANMMRQQLTPPDPEPALVRTGHEPADPAFWCGRNLLTAFIAWDGAAFEDGLVLSESAAKRLSYSEPVEPGDKLSNRHGAKGVVSRILPDAEMPCLADGTPVELIYSLCGLPTRMNFGQLREAVMGRVAKATGASVVVEPFKAPSDAELRQRLKEAGLPEDGMEPLTLGGKALPYRSTVGWVYWGPLHHRVREKIHTSGAGRLGHLGQRHGEMEYVALLQAGAVETILEHFNTRSAARADADTLEARVAAGPVEQAGPPSPAFETLAQRLNAAGIRMTLQDGTLAFRFDVPAGASIELARPVAHPWHPRHSLDKVGKLGDVRGTEALEAAGAKLRRMIDGGAPDALVQEAYEQLRERVKTYLDQALTRDALRFQGRHVFSGRSVIVPDPSLRLDQVGLPEQMMEPLFGPMLKRQAGVDLDGLAATSWVLIHRAPTVSPTRFLAFHPVRHADRAIRLHPLACVFLDADFDGDQVAVSVPITEAAQTEAGARLSIAAHVERDPALLDALAPRMDALWGLAQLALTEKGRMDVEKMAGHALGGEAIVTAGWVKDALRAALERDGLASALELAQRLMRRGFEAARESGGSMSPFFGVGLERPGAPKGRDPDQWQAYMEETAGKLREFSDYANAELGPACLAAHSGARGTLQHLAMTMGPRGNVLDGGGRLVAVRHGWREGLKPDELFLLAAHSRENLAQVVVDLADIGHDVIQRGRAAGYGVLARARRADRPGIVFARAAAARETDPLSDVDSRLFVGLPAS